MSDLEYSDVSLSMTDEELPSVSVLIPCWRRRKFIPLMIANIIGQDYPLEKIELCILQDGDQDLFLNKERYDMFKNSIGVKLNYIYEPNVRRTIGEKRNMLVKMATHKICAMMDSDDIYLPSYLRYSVNALKQYNANITSSASMLFVYPKLDFKMTGIRCNFKHQCHEACCVFKKKFFRGMGGFTKSSQGEGVKLFQGTNQDKIINLDITKLMVCVAHEGEQGNTIDKNQFGDNTLDCKFQDTIYKQILIDISKV